MLILIIFVPLIIIIINWINYNEKRNLILNILYMYIGYYLIIVNNNNEEINYLLNIKNNLIGIDGLNISLIWLVMIIVPILNLIDDEKEKYKKSQIINIIGWLLIMVFISLDITLIYIFFELLLVPLIILIINKKEASIRLFIYTLLTSIIFIPLICILNIKYGNTNILLLKYMLNWNNEIIWILTFIIFLVKIPIIPLHTWLPFAHVEASTTGSVILAGLILKVGLFGLVRMNIGLLNDLSYYYSPIIITLSIISIYYSTLIIYRLTDIKRIIAYSSIIHMNLSIIGLYSNTLEGILGSLINNINHGLLSSAYFICIGIIYRRYSIKIITYFKGLISVMPLWTTLWIIINIIGLSLPGTLAFIGEYLIFQGAFFNNNLIGFLLVLNVFTSTIYIMKLINNICFNKLSPYLLKTNDITQREYFILLPLITFNIGLGLNPNLLNNLLLNNSLYLITL